MTHQQAVLLAFIGRYQADNSGVCPTLQEMADAISLRSKGGIHRLLCRLEERGHIMRHPRKARAIEIVSIATSDAERLVEVIGRLVASDGCERTAAALLELAAKITTQGAH